jgi:hypothetical protein
MNVQRKNQELHEGEEHHRFFLVQTLIQEVLDEILAKSLQQLVMLLCWSIGFQWIKRRSCVLCLFCYWCIVSLSSDSVGLEYMFNYFARGLVFVMLCDVGVPRATQRDSCRRGLREGAWYLVYFDHPF